MSFAENLRRARKTKGMSQEELAALLGVSRQAVSKWEQGTGYPETEKLKTISNNLNVSLDYLLDNEKVENESWYEKKSSEHMTGKITIISAYENVMATCYKVQSTGRMRGGKRSPRYALFGVSDSASFWGQTTTFLGWYEEKEQIEKEMNDIENAIRLGQDIYKLKYNVKVIQRGLKRIIEEVQDGKSEENH